MVKRNVSVNDVFVAPAAPCVFRFVARRQLCQQSAKQQTRTIDANACLAEKKSLKSGNKAIGNRIESNISRRW